MTRFKATIQAGFLKFSCSINYVCKILISHNSSGTVIALNLRLLTDSEAQNTRTGIHEGF